MSLADALEEAASALEADADAIRPANGDPRRLLEMLASDEAGGAEAAGRVLAWLLDHRALDAVELGMAWSEAADGAAAVLAVDESSLPKAGRKALRRILHGLRSRGIAAENAPRPVVASLPSVEDDFEAAYLSALDPSGARMVYLAEANPGGGVRMFEIVLDEGQGIAGFEVYTAPRKKTRAFLDQLETKGRMPMVSVDAPTARAVVAYASAHQTSDRSPPRAFAEWRGRITDAGDTPLPGAVVAAALEGAVATDEGALRRAEAMARDGRIGPWPAGPEVLKQLLERIRTAHDSPLIVSGATRREQIDQLLDESTREIYDQPARSMVAHRLRESAFVYWKTDHEDEARACLAAAARLESADLEIDPVARAFLEVPLMPSIEALEREEKSDPAADDEPKLVTPAVGGTLGGGPR